MKFIAILPLLCFSIAPAFGVTIKELHGVYAKHASRAEKAYRDFHQNPELSGLEFRTAEKMKEHLGDLGYKVTDKIGGTGLVAVFRNGIGPTIWLRADMDGLPIHEETKKSYASKVKGVMHACGHDTHLAAMIGYAAALKDLKNSWKGTLVLIVQPAEEIGQGAELMIEDGLFRRFPKPDMILAFHVDGEVRSGQIRYTSGFALTAVDSIDIEIKGFGGHGATPEATVDPIVLASKVIVSLQTLVSRNVSPNDPVVLSFGSLHGGSKHNIIPDRVHIQGTLRTYSKNTRQKMLKGIKRMTYALAEAEQAPRPTLKFSNSSPATYNNPLLTQKMLPIFSKAVGQNNYSGRKGVMNAEDFSYYRQSGKYPTMLYFIGGAPKNQKNYGANHSSKFSPEYKKVIEVAVVTMALSVLEFLPEH